MYAFFRKALFHLAPETAHWLALNSLKVAHQIKLTSLLPKAFQRPTSLMGLHFLNTVGLAAGFDKNGDYIDALASLGFGFIEIGTVTPKPQAGNTLPRLFRLPRHQALINRMGFNNKGIEYVKWRIQKSNYQGILGVNIGKNKDTPNERAIEDYRQGFKAFSPYASYITVNVSSPNTAGLRDLQGKDHLGPLISALKEEQARFANERYVPIVIKIAPDLSEEELNELALLFLALKVDGVIATNTTLSRDDIQDDPLRQEAGGLSGQPLAKKSTAVIRVLKEQLKDQIPIIASGGIMDEKEARQKKEAGASLIQLYTGLIYAGPRLIKQIAELT